MKEFKRKKKEEFKRKKKKRKERKKKKRKGRKKKKRRKKTMMTRLKKEKESLLKKKKSPKSFVQHVKNQLKQNNVCIIQIVHITLNALNVQYARRHSVKEIKKVIMFAFHQVCFFVNNIIKNNKHQMHQAKFKVL